MDELQGTFIEVEDNWDDDEDNIEILNGVKIIHNTPLARLVMHNNRTAWFPRSISILDGDSILYPYSFDPTWKAMHAAKRKPIEGDFV